MRTTLMVWLCVSWCAVSFAQKGAEKQVTIAYLQSLQNEDGGFAMTKGGASELGATSAAARALKTLGSVPKDKDGAIAFLYKCANPDGSFGPKPGAPGDVRSTALGLMGLFALTKPKRDVVDAGLRYLESKAKAFEEVRIAAAAFEAAGALPTENVRERWLKELAGAANPDGTYGKGDTAAFETGGAAALILRLGGKLKNRKAIAKVLREGQRPDGGFSRDGMTSALEPTYRVLRAFVMMNLKLKDVGACREFVAKCRNEDGGYGIAPGKSSSAIATYFAVTVLHWLENKL